MFSSGEAGRPGRRLPTLLSNGRTKTTRGENSAAMPEAFPGDLETPLVDAASGIIGVPRIGQRLDVRFKTLHFAPPDDSGRLAPPAAASRAASHSQPLTPPLPPFVLAVGGSAAGPPAAGGFLLWRQARESLLHARRLLDTLAHQTLHEGCLCHVSRRCHRRRAPTLPSMLAHADRWLIPPALRTASTSPTQPWARECCRSLSPTSKSTSNPHRNPIPRGRSLTDSL